jgi:hypothetical protein
MGICDWGNGGGMLTITCGIEARLSARTFERDLGFQPFLDLAHQPPYPPSHLLAIPTRLTTEYQVRTHLSSPT